MRNKMLTVMGLAVGVGLMLAALVWAATGNGPYYAMPAWDQKQAAATRFIVLTDWNSQAVLDRETGLVWEQAPSIIGTENWRFARADCAILTTGGRMGWRLPSLPELMSLVDPNAAGTPFLPSGHPFTNVQPAAYWTASTSADSPTGAWIVRINFATPSSDLKTNSNFVWCVRGGMNADQY